ncbi:PepSY-associated TM helix domain-containing protein [Pseudoalteromonas sp. SG43-7]|uniref:PepSY-associated TM helix domain-containing protein n=1 Tax=Pseudoalteromonas TaxID=53246 RepID=UPI0012304DE5|nr:MULTISPECIES: PepSY-associated TM helix domain-containing protein [Pseudoalteromonas]MBB1332337.1 PepSY-associated TM helix domain-containing protein [Pseudoalteromonas sp. SR41-6]MBB1416022.1 PepSY-associated TM helix domain-containing protein [Pseudoalteromonas sp. SG44-1]MBB1423301.1 PepSY-associated TM helix domain-containing protein [Pseudoalteromonas sp. SG43-7]MBB1432817.1 PepSY-associated TM helix domain-containing protein [Pseudoalteromonas sp. SG43-6]MBB1457595.1 PepSY-associated 
MPLINKRTLYSTSRALHIYLSTALLFLLILFAVSGIVLNHVDWLEGDKSDGQLTTSLPSALLEQGQENLATLPILYPEIEAYLANQYGLTKVKSIDWEKEDALVMLDYPLPAGFAFAELNFISGELNLEYQTGGFLSLIGDLHKGRHSGEAWSWVIDISAVLMIFFAITGMIILFQNRKKRLVGIWLTVLGVATPAVIYLCWVPQLKGVS